MISCTLNVEKFKCLLYVILGLFLLYDVVIKDGMVAVQEIYSLKLM
ncbi:MAG: hypothetical protein QXY40_09705 [Candidatus Methanomethylicia archaeon]